MENAKNAVPIAAKAGVKKVSLVRFGTLSVIMFSKCHLVNLNIAEAGSNCWAVNSKVFMLIKDHTLAKSGVKKSVACQVRNVEHMFG